MIFKTDMNRHSRILSKRGSYILESTISLPIFIIAIIVMSSIILMYACIEDSNFIMATELRRGAAEAITVDTSAMIPVRISSRIRDHSIVESVSLSDYGYRTSRWEQDELIVISFKMGMNTENPLTVASRASYDVALVTRAYVGKIRNQENMSEADMMDDGDRAVYIFPKRGEKYHKEGCGFLKAASKSSALTEEIKKKYKSCPICHSKNASNGALIYYFPAAGESFHLPGCETLQRNYIELEKRVAVKRGYTACSKCGG